MTPVRYRVLTRRSVDGREVDLAPLTVPPDALAGALRREAEGHRGSTLLALRVEPLGPDGEVIP